MRYALLVLILAGVAAGAGVTLRGQSTFRLHAASAETEAVPLVVVLHGDHEDSRASLRRWQTAVEARGWELLALDCPRDRGCEDGSWYRWNGNPRWLRDRVHDVTSKRAIDPTRIYLVGWSGGATYIGMHLQAWPDLFAAVVIHGGGVPPRNAHCIDRTFPAYFLVGDQNPAHGAAVRLRDHFDRCGQEVKWDLVPGANHPREDAALTRAKADAILRWLYERRRNDALS
ncbi:MAG TPA: PHB depolymerase family esterase [Kofleriaceae bacterium]|nr:PHB depolymerase family esterase [Kofleriaceae bacterium]